MFRRIKSLDGAVDTSPVTERRVHPGRWCGGLHGVALAALAVALLLSSACASLSGYGRQQQTRSSSLVEYLYPDGKVPAGLREARPRLVLPLRVGIAFVPDENHGGGLALSEAQRQQTLERVAEHFRQRPFIEDVVSIPRSYLTQQKGFDSLQQVAQLFGVDVVALVSWNLLTRQDNNALSLAYWTIVGAYIVPGDELRTQTFVDTAVFDVSTRKLLMRAPGVDRRERLSTMAASSATEREMLEASFDAAAGRMIANLDGELDDFVARVEAQSAQVDVDYRPGYTGGTGAIGVFGLLLIAALALRRGALRRTC